MYLTNLVVNNLLGVLRIEYPDYKFRLNDSSGHIEHNTTVYVSANFRLELPTLERDVNKFKSGKTVDA